MQKVINTDLMDHPFHLHEFYFQILEENGNAPVNHARKEEV